VGESVVFSFVVARLVLSDERGQWVARKQIGPRKGLVASGPQDRSGLVSR
jgi:hypothetical protein